EIAEARSVEEAVADAPIVTTVTRATQAFLRAPALARGTHVNAVGAITEERLELDDDVFARCTKAVVDDLSAAQRLSTEFVRAFGETNRWNEVGLLSELVAQRIARGGADDITVFKAMGMGVSDLALGLEILRRAKAAGLGKPLTIPQRAAP